jgi:hypothetical protein
VAEARRARAPERWLNVPVIRVAVGASSNSEPGVRERLVGAERLLGYSVPAADGGEAQYVRPLASFRAPIARRGAHGTHLAARRGLTSGHPTATETPAPARMSPDAEAATLVSSNVDSQSSSGRYRREQVGASGCQCGQRRTAEGLPGLCRRMNDCGCCPLARSWAASVVDWRWRHIRTLSCLTNRR